MPGKKEKSRRSPFQAFGAFLTSHMMKKFARKRVKQKKYISQDALEAGFVDSNSNESEELTNGNHKSGHSSETASLSGKAVYSTALDESFMPPGVCGLANHGTTCYINAIIQCLSNTDLLAEYFVMGQYKSDLKNAKKERSKKYGTNGELAEQIAVLIRSLWTNQYDVAMTKGLKDIMCKYASQYKGNEQHDSQEFLLWLFDKVHEDLNIQPNKKPSLLSRASFRKKKKPPPPPKYNVGRSNFELQAQLDIVPTSFIQKVFQAHFRSTLSCPSCHRQSHTMDPSLCVSLPVMARHTRAIYVNVVHLPSKKRSERKKSGCRVVRISVAAPLNGKVLDLRHLVASECGIHSRLLTFADFDEFGFGKSYGDDFLIDKFPTSTPTACKLHAFEMPAPTKMTAGTLPRNFASRHKKRPSFGEASSIKQDGDITISSAPKNVVVILVNKDEESSKIIGLPLIFHVSKDIKDEDFRSLVASKISKLVKKGVDAQKLVETVELSILDGLPGRNHISSKSPMPFMSPSAETALQNCAAGGPLHLKVVAEWKSDDVEALFEVPPQDDVEEQESVRLQRLLHQQPVTCTLQECFELLTKPEKLSLEDAWMCPHCEKQQQGVKKLSLYTLPDVLVIHLKRFHVVNDKRTKLNTRVDFPIMGLDMTPYLLESSRPKTAFYNGGHKVNGLRNSSSAKNEECLYDLYAVCNHFGNMNSGHYTACCLNPLDGQWYQYDDKKTELISEENLSQQSVYILFYQRRSINPTSPCAGGSVSSLAMSDHWASGLQQHNRKKASSQSRLNEYAVNHSAPMVTVGHSQPSPAKAKSLPKTPPTHSPRKAKSAQSTPTKMIHINGGSKSNQNGNNNNNNSHVQIGNRASTVQIGNRPSSEKTYHLKDPSEFVPSPNCVRRYSGSIELYRREKEAMMESRRDRSRSSMKDYRNGNAPRSPARNHHDNSELTYANPISPKVPAHRQPAAYPQYLPPVLYPQNHSPDNEGQAFIRGLPRQRSVPRSVSKPERGSVSPRRLSERYRKSRPASQYDRQDSYQRSTYF